MTATEYRELVRSTLYSDEEFDLITAYRDGKPLSVDQLVALSGLPALPAGLRREFLQAATAAQGARLEADHEGRNRQSSAAQEGDAHALPARNEGAQAGAPRFHSGAAYNTEVPECDLRDAEGWKDDLSAIPADFLADCYDEGGVGAARMYNALNRGRIVMVFGWSKFLIWQGHHWVRDDYGVAFQRTEAVVAAFDRMADGWRATAEDPSSTPEARGFAEAALRAHKKKINGLRSKAGQENLLAQCVRISHPLMVMPDQIDADPYALACPNGVINLKTGALLPGRPTDYLLKACPTIYRPELLEADDPCPETSAFLLASMNGHREVVEFIWRLLGYGLIRKRKDHVFGIFWGPHGRNGKDTLIKLLTHVLGQGLSGSVPVEMLLQSSQTRNSSAPSPDVMALMGMCLGWANEAEDGQRFAMARLKALTGGGLITARGLMDREMTTFQQSHLLIMCTNELPRAKADDDAFWARALIIKWELSFVPHPDPNKEWQRQDDKNLDEKVQAEAEGVLARLVRGAMDYMREGLNVPAQVRQWTDTQRDLQDDLAAFLAECCVVEPRRETLDGYQLKIRSNELYECWQLWYAENRDKRHIPSGKALGIMLDKREIEKRVSNGTWRLGIQLNAEWDARMEAEHEAGTFRRGNGSASFRGGSNASL